MSLPRLYFITQDRPNFSHQDQARAALEGGVKLLQLRIKNPIGDAPIKIALDIKIMCESYDAVLIINDDILLAKACRAHGVHLGLKDETISQARKVLGNDAIIGGTANTREDVQYQLDQGANYIGLGPYRFTQTKKNLSPIIGIEDYYNICSQYNSVPIYAVGGIKENHVIELMTSGIYGLAVSSAITSHPDPSLAAQNLIELIDSNSTLVKNYG